MVRALEVIKLVHEFEALEIVADAVPPVTLGTLDPLVVHPAALNAIAVDSALPPLVVSGGVKVREPVMLVQLTPPVASVSEVVVGLALGPELEPHAVADTANNPIEMTSHILTVCPLDIARPPCSPRARRYCRAWS
jgi:hypothetical protein